MTQHLARTGMKRVKKDLLHVAFNILVPIHAPASLRSADMNPVRSAITGAGEAFRIDKGFEQQRFDTISIQPVIDKLTSSDRQYFAGKMRNLDPGEDEESAVIDNAGKVALTDGIAPADPVVSGSDFQAALVKSRQATIRFESGRLRTKYRS